MKKYQNRFYRRRTSEWISQRRTAVISSSAALLVAGIGGFIMLTHNPVKPAPGHTQLTTYSTDPLKEGDLLAGQWDYLPGSTRQANGLRITALPFAIVKQDGSAGQTNTPINLAGTHLESASDFTITADLTDVGATAGDTVGMSLYGQVPVIADEFRVERKSVRVHIKDTTLTLSVWDGTKQDPLATVLYAMPAALQKDDHLRITHTGDMVEVSVNDGPVITIADGGVFNDGSVWFGFDAENDGFTIAGLTAKALGDKTFKIADGSSLRVTGTDPNGLQTLAAIKRPGFLVGAAMALGPLATDQQYAQVALGGNFGAITPENAMKWQSTEPARGVFDFKDSDALVRLAQQQGLKVQGHTLVFGEANPTWVRQLPTGELEKAMTDHIAGVVGHFKGKMYSWDVVNEPFDDDEWDTFRPNLWYNAMGQNYIAKAFTAAHAADPDALLFMNEYGLEEDGSRWDNFLKLVTDLKKQGVPIDGVGFQTHVYERGDKINTKVLQKHMQQLAAIGVKSRISEMDVYSDDGTRVQAQQYANVFGMCLNEPSCISWTTWGVSDRYDYFIDDDGSVQTGEDFLWNADMQPTPAVDKIRQLLR
jgi:endo-1,4-beta-xylanase